MTKKHAKLSASGADKWLNCAGSIQLEEYVQKKYPTKESFYAREGTIAHELAEKVLSNEILLNTSGSVHRFVNHTIDDFKIEEEMCEHVNNYIDYVYSHLNDGEFYVEEKVKFDDYVPEGFGTLDAAIVDSVSNRVHIFDLKYGKRVVVNPDDNNQLKMYALGFYQSHGDLIKKYEIDSFRLHIVQPRVANQAHRYRYWDIGLNDLLEFGEFVKTKAKEALSPNPTYTIGEKQCRWCKAKHVCPEQNKVIDADILEQFDNVPDETELDRVARILDNKKLILDYIKSVENFAMEHIEQGKEIPNYEIRNYTGRRQWKPDALAQFGQEANSALFDTITETRLLSIGKIENVLKKSGYDIGDYTTAPIKKTLVRSVKEEINFDKLNQ